MGRPGGFFKKLKAKERRASSRKQRGTKGASKEDRRRKHNERVELYAAKREAEQLAAVSSSSEEEPSTDSEAEEYRQTKSLRKLQRLLGVAPSSDSPAASHKRSRQQLASTSRHDDSDDDEDEMMRGARNNSGALDSDDASAEGSSSVNGQRKRRSPPQRRCARYKRAHATASVGRVDDSDLDGEDWRLYLGGVSGSDDEGEEGVDGSLEADDEEVTELAEETDDADDVVDRDLLTDSDDGVDGDEESDDDDNPLFDLEKGDGDVDDDDDGADLFDDAMMIYDDEEDEEDDDEEREDAFVDDDDDDAATGKVREKSARERLLLQSFQLDTSSVSILRQCGAVGGANDTKGEDRSSAVLTEKDEWMRKYHLDLHGPPDETPLKPLPVPHAALEVLAESNKLLQARAAERLQTTADKKELGVFFASPEECAAIHPENVAVLATAHAQQHLLHAPFDVQWGAASLPSPSAAQAADPWTECPAYLHPALWERWTAFRAHRSLPTFTAEERGLLDLLQGYADLLDTLHCWQNSESRREIFALHLLNHWFKARSVVLAHDTLLAKRREERRRRCREPQKRRNGNGGGTRDSDAFYGEAERLAQQSSTSKRVPQSKGKFATSRQSTLKKVAKADGIRGEAGGEEQEGDLDVDEEELELRDRGFSKTRLCVMCPLRNHAYKFVYSLVSILQADPSKCPKLAMFEQDFTEIEEAVDPTFRRRPRDYQRTFEGNIDDSFCVGLRLEPERVHVYSHPLNSDLLVCSPLGLRRRIEKNGDVLVSLSSIEVCLLEDAQMLFQQNWMHVAAVLELLNKRPTDTTHGLSDLRRVYAWALEGKSGRHRQTIVSTDVCNATILSTFRTASVNNSGKLLLQRRVDSGVLSRVLVPVRQHFIRFDPTSLATVDDDRFAFFTKQVYEAKINAMAERDVRIILFVPSYFDFVRLRNYLHREYRESYVALCEYTSLKQQRQALGQFSDRERPVLLVTERFYYFRRYFVKLAEVLIFYSPPMFPEYYASLTNKLVATSPSAFTMTLYCRYDTHELNRVVGTSRMEQLLERDSGVFSFITS